MSWGTDREIERRNRIRLSIWAFAYEVMDVSLVSDAEFDALALQIRPEMETGNRVLDMFFKTEFHPNSGMWVRKHPDQAGLRRCFERIYPANQPVLAHEG